MTLDWKLCKKCDEFFDIGINFDICPKCREKEIKDLDIKTAWEIYEEESSIRNGRVENNGKNN